MNNDKRKALMDEASRFRERAAQHSEQESIARWDCGRGHRWDESLDHAQNVRCISCASQRREIEAKRLHDIARVRGGVFQPQAFVDAGAPLSWECAHGHRWNARAEDAERRWCEVCARTVFASYRE
jgi:hypothetical protein